MTLRQRIYWVLAILALVILVPILWPSPNPDVGDKRWVLIFNPPAAAAPPSR